MLGALIGDIVGSRFEFTEFKGKKFEFFEKHCHPTDDSLMTLAIAKALVVCKDWSDEDIWPMISLMLVMSIAGIFGASGSVFLLTKGQYGTQTVSNWMFMQVYNTVGNPDVSNAYNYLSAVGLLLTVVSFAISMAVRRIANSYFEGVTY